ncbi:MAG: sulfur carrier protein ThiS [Halopseudomonas sp.]
MDIELNGDRQQLAVDTSISALLDQLGLADKRVAVEYNLDILPKSQHSGTAIQAGDRIEIVHAIGGG